MTDLNNNNNKSTELILFIMCLAIIGGIILLYTEIHKHNMIAQSRFSYMLNKDFENNAIDTAIANDIEQGKHILDSSGGRWTERQLTNYLGFFELMQDYIDAGSINIRDVYDNYSDDILNAYTNKELVQYITRLRLVTKDNAYYDKFEKLAKNFTTSNKVK